ncbi:hypothetical protein JCM12856_01520 [Spirochaeta dissipatitropha]
MNSAEPEPAEPEISESPEPAEPVEPAVPQPPEGSGRILDIQHEVTYSTAQINSMAAQLFGGDRPSAEYAVDVYRIEFESLGMDEEVTRVFSQLFVPRSLESMEAPLYVFAAGTTGLSDLCRTSREHEIGINWGLYRNHMLAHAGQGSIGMLPDYMYFGDPSRLQPYFVPQAEARVLLDSVRAARSFFFGAEHAVRPDPRPFLAGFSQGGHAIFAAADQAADYAADIEIAGLIGYGASTDIENLFREFTLVAAPIIYTYAELYGEDRFDPAVMIQDRWLESLFIDVRRLCILGLQDYYPWGPDNFFRPDFLRSLRRRTLEADFPEIHAILQENSSGLSGHGIPALILQGGNDVVIDLADMEHFVSQLRDNGSEVEYLVYPGSRHDTRQIGFSDARRWMQQRMSTEE